MWMQTGEIKGVTLEMSGIKPIRSTRTYANFQTNVLTVNQQLLTVVQFIVSSDPYESLSNKLLC